MEGTEDGKLLYSRVLSRGTIDDNGFLNVSELFKTMVEDNNRGCKGMEHNKRVVCQSAGDGCIKMYYSEEAFKAYIKSLVVEMVGPQKRIGGKPEV